LLGRLDGQYLLVEKMKPAFTLEQMLLSQLNEKAPPEAETDLRRLAEAVAPFSYIGDFDPSNVVFDSNTKQWKVLDFNDIGLFQGELMPVHFSNKEPFGDTRSNEYRALQEAIRQHRGAPHDSYFASAETRYHIEHDPIVSDATLDRADVTFRQLNRWVRDAQLRMLDPPAEGKKLKQLTGTNPLTGERFTIVPDQVGTLENIAAARLALDS
jgi:hypothetical protein